MARILPPASSSPPPSTSQLSPSLLPSLLLSSSSCSRLRVPLSRAYIPSRRIALLHLGGAIPQSLLSGVKASTLLRLEGNSIEGSTAANMAQPSTNVTENNAIDWVKNDNRRMLHVVYRVGDLDKTIKFYTECLGMKLLRKRDIPEERYSNAFLGYGPEESNFAIELTYNYGVDKYDIGTGFGHFGIAVKDVMKVVDLVKAKGGKVTGEPSPIKGGNTTIAFIEDPDGYKFKLLERGPTPEPLCQLMLRVGDLDRSITYHKKAYGMELLRKRDYPEYKYTTAMMGYGPEDKNVVLELTYNYGVKEYDKGNGYAQIAIGTNDVYKTAEAIKVFGGKIALQPGPLPGINTKIMACLDPDGWKSVGYHQRYTNQDYLEPEANQVLSQSPFNSPSFYSNRIKN
ncbi:probable lactoylglutathione lyase, chloroplastic isoform X1 [Rhododendron vialii]|uniref:probable lactoylglutathione lyase, chloroplastic isoform X1 n=1 Tax=Rhododendron vialii TaxID=182163 RepID=UPI00265FE747|nr:probable lactoylglutathione lyase, chloroplastic isoform X1 [Rhododendron vialii]